MNKALAYKKIIKKLNELKEPVIDIRTLNYRDLNALIVLTRKYKKSA